MDDIDVLFQSCRFVEWDYNGSIDHPVLALLVEMAYDDNGKQEVAQQYYSAGDLSRFQPSEDGSHAVAVGSARGMADSTNAAELIKSVIDQGFPEDRFGDGDVSAMEGLSCHINRVPQKKRGGNISDKNAAGYDKTVAIVTKIHQMPWESSPAPANRPAGGRPNGRPATSAATRPTTAAAARTPARTAAAAPETASTDDLTVESAEILIAVLEGKQGTVGKTGIAPAAFKPLAGNANRAAILANITNDDWLYENGENFGWSFDGKQVTAG